MPSNHFINGIVYYDKNETMRNEDTKLICFLVYFFYA
jgi:hypothetical protein